MDLSNQTQKSLLKTMISHRKKINLLILVRQVNITAQYHKISLEHLVILEDQSYFFLINYPMTHFDAISLCFLLFNEWDQTSSLEYNNRSL